MGKGKSAARAARLAARAKPAGPVYITVKVMESYEKPSGAIGLRTRWVKYLKEDWDARWNKK